MTTKTSPRNKLLKRLKGFRTLNAASIDTLDAGLVARLDDTIQALEAPVRVVVAGLADADHHSVAGLLGGTTLLDAGTDATACPSLHLRAGAELLTAAHVNGRDRAFRGCVVDKLVSLRTQTPIQLDLPTMALSHVEVSVLPVYDRQDEQSQYLLDMIENSDAIIWCTSAVTPWHSRERRLWFTIPDDLKMRSILALTGADGIDADADTRAIYEEKCEIAAENFAALVALSPADKGTTRTLLDSLTGLTDGTVVDDAMALRRELDTIPIGVAQAAPGPAPLPVAPAPASPAPVAAPPSLRSRIADEAQACIAATQAASDGDAMSLFDAMTALLSSVETSLSGERRLIRDHDALLAELSEATDLVTLLSYEGTDEAVGEAAILVQQVVIDVLNRLPDGQAEEACVEEFREAS